MALTASGKYVFNGLDGFAGFRSGQTCQLTPDVWDDGTVTVEMPHAPKKGRAKLTETQWGEWWEKAMLGYYKSRAYINLFISCSSGCLVNPK